MSLSALLRSSLLASASSQHATQPCGLPAKKPSTVQLWVVLVSDMLFAAMQIPEDVLDENWVIELCISMAKRYRPLTWQGAMMIRQQFTMGHFEATMLSALATFDTFAPPWLLTVRLAYIKAATEGVPTTGVGHTPPWDVCTPHDRSLQ
jgi:hypothetical protein